MPKATRTIWPGGGYIRQGKKRPTYVIDRWIGGKHFHVSTRCHSLKAAMKQLERFESNPAAYRPEGEKGEQRAAVTMTAELTLSYRDWMIHEKKTSKAWARDCARLLADWIEDLGGKDLRDVSVQHDLKPALTARKKRRRHRIEAIKAFYKWLRVERGLITHKEDPTVDLPVPQAIAEKIRRKKVVPREVVAKVLRQMEGATGFAGLSRDVLMLRTGTSWHINEVRRFAETGEIVRPVGGNLLAVLITKHKSGDLTRTPIQYQEHLDAAERIRAAGRIPTNTTMTKHLHDAAVAAEVTKFVHGWMRHSVLTWAVEMGATPAQASEFAGHKSLATTKKFYLDVAVPTTTVPVLRLVKG